MDFTYVIILVVVLVTSPFVLKLASNQGKKTKQNLKLLFIFILLIQVLLGLFNWENFTVGRNGYQLSSIYPNSFLGLFFGISILQVFLLLLSKSSHTIAVILNLINSILVFISMIRLSNILGFQAISLPSISVVFLVLLGDVVGLTFINKDNNLLKKYLNS